MSVLFFLFFYQTAGREREKLREIRKREREVGEEERERWGRIISINFPTILSALVWYLFLGEN